MSAVPPLPIDAHLPAIAEAVHAHRAAVLVAPPGTGKTTRVAPFLVRSGTCGPGAILVLEPRRIAAQAAAARIAAESSWTLGREVGYQVRFERRLTSRTRIQVLTSGVFLRRLESNPYLEGVSLVILDEFHERSVSADLALGMLRDLQSTVREDLHVVVMSATLVPEDVAAYLGDCPVVAISGRVHTLEIEHRYRPRDTPLAEAVLSAIESAWLTTQGNTLVFLPGMAEIRRAQRALGSFAQRVGAALVPLHGRLSLSAQERAISPSPERRIVLATNVAETSLTIEGVDLVVDSGLARQLRSDTRHGIDRLETVRISRQAAEQRSGRAGRTGPGRVLRLWSAAQHTSRGVAEVSEVRRVDLASAVLELRAWGVRDPRTFAWFEPPDDRALERAEQLLLFLGAIAQTHGSLTPRGQRMLSLPVHPRLGSLLVTAAERGCLREAALLAALLEDGELLRELSHPGAAAAPRERAGDDLDLMGLIDALRARESGRRDRSGAAIPGIDAGRLLTVLRLRDALLAAARRVLEDGAQPSARLGIRDGLEDAVLAAYPDRVARRRGPGSRSAVMVGGKGVVLATDNAAIDGELFVAVDIEEGAETSRGEAVVGLAVRTTPRRLTELFGKHVSEKTESFFDEKLEKIRCRTAVHFLDLALEGWREKRPDPEQAARGIAEAVAARAEAIFSADGSARRWIARARFAREQCPDVEMPAFEAEELGRILAAASAGSTALAEVRALDLAQVLRDALGARVAQAVDRLAPDAILIPSGRRAPLDYADGKPPVLAVRLQELFGCSETPRVARGRVPVVLHLLGPNQRVVQITQDLASFWRNTYPQVRKDLRGRYPKHSWPEDPLASEPERGPRRRRRE